MTTPKDSRAPEDSGELQIPQAPDDIATPHDGRSAVTTQAGGAETSRGSRTPRAFAKVRHELSDDELCTPGAVRLLLSENERLSTSLATLDEVRNQFHQADKRCAVLAERGRRSVALEVAFAVALTVGSSLLSITPQFWDKQPYGLILMLIGGVLLLGGIAFRIIWG